MKFKLFVLSLLLTTGVLLTIIYVHRPQSAEPELVPVVNNLFITSQLSTKSIYYLKTKGVATVVDLRPDGEAPDQPPASKIEIAAKLDGISFYYIPVPHENIPDEAVATLAEVLSQQNKPTVLYCRSGKRAARTFALAEASRTDGPDTDAICKMVRGAGFSADDLREKISQRVSHRSNLATDKFDGSTTKR